MQKPDLIIFAKAAQRGFVKTRLAQDIGKDKALHVYKRLLKITFDVAASYCKEHSTTLHLYWCANQQKDRLNPEEHFKPFLQNFSATIQFHEQKGHSLANRLKNAFAAVLKNKTTAMCIGCDCPTLSAVHLHDITETLESHNVAFGPAEDGGYWAIGIRTQPNNFPIICNACFAEELPWSKNGLLEESLKRLRKQNISAALGTELYDVDTLKELQRANFLTR